MNKTSWLRYALTSQTNTSAYTFVQGTSGRVRGVTGRTPRVRRDSTIPTFRAAAKKIAGLWRRIVTLLILAAMRTSLLIRGSITSGKWLAKAKHGLMRLFLLPTSIRKRIGNWKLSTGNKSSKKTSTWDKLFAYVAIVIFAVLAIRPTVISDVLPRIAIVMLATHSIVRRFR